MKTIVQLDQSAFRAVITGDASRTIHDVIDDLKRIIIFEFGGIKSGKKGRFRQASAVGEAPAIQTGNLFRHLFTFFPTPLTGELLIDTPYARILEEELSRPFIKPAVESVAQRFAVGALGRFA